MRCGVNNRLSTHPPVMISQETPTVPCNQQTKQKRQQRFFPADLHELQTQDQIIGPVIAALIKERPMRTLVKQYVRLFLRDGVLIADRQTSDVVSSSSWLCPAPFGLTSLQLFMTRWVTRATNEPWSC